MEGLGLEMCSLLLPPQGQTLETWKWNSHFQVHNFRLCWAGASRLSRRAAGGTHLSSDSYPALILGVGKLHREKKLAPYCLPKTALAGDSSLGDARLGDLSHFANVETKTLRGKMLFPKLYSRLVAESEFELLCSFLSLLLLPSPIPCPLWAFGFPHLLPLECQLHEGRDLFCVH